MNLDDPDLADEFVRLEPLEEHHRDALRQPAAQDALWTWMPVTGAGSNFDAYFDHIMSEKIAARILPFAVHDQTDDRFVGVTAFMAISKLHRRVEIGHTWYDPEVQGGMTNPACKRLLLQRAFDWGALRVELKADSRNARSRAAMKKLGATEEGILRSHMRLTDGTRRDTVYYSILKSEWPDVRAGLDQRLRGDES